MTWTASVVPDCQATQITSSQDWPRTAWSGPLQSSHCQCLQVRECGRAGHHTGIRARLQPPVLKPQRWPCTTPYLPGPCFPFCEEILQLSRARRCAAVRQPQDEPEPGVAEGSGNGSARGEYRLHGHSPQVTKANPLRQSEGRA